MSMATRPFGTSLRVVVIAVLLATAGFSASATPASAGYIYRPGDVMYFGGTPNHGAVSLCTGGYIITGASGTFLTTDGHCADYGQGSPGYPVYGTQRAFGTVAYSKWPYQDTELVTESYGDDAWQTVVDPKTGRTPGGSGKVVGRFLDQEFYQGMVVGKMGYTTGWQEGRIVFTFPWHNMNSYCTTAAGEGGDSGGPVWQAWPGGGVKAAGLTVIKVVRNGNSYTCFLSISDLLYVWGATSFPVWSSASRSATRSTVSAPANAPRAPSLPHIDSASAKVEPI